MSHNPTDPVTYANFHLAKAYVMILCLSEQLTAAVGV